MKNSITKYILILLITLCACNKVQDDLEAQYDQPSIALSGVTLPDGSYLAYPQNVKPGDTITIAGRLNLTKGGVIRLGKQNAVITDRGSLQLAYPATNTSYTIETASFVVTTDMGSGPQPLTVSCGAYSVTAPDINIIVPGMGGSEPDTSLIVTQVFDGHGTEDFMEKYKTLTTSSYINVSASVTNDGTVYFATERDIYRIKNGLLDYMVKEEDSIVIESKKYPLTTITGMVPDPNNQSLYFSFFSQIPSPENYNRIYWLVKKDVASGVITVLNKTEIQFDGELTTGVTRPSGNIYGKVPVNQMPVYASNLKVDAKGRLLFLNFNPYNFNREIEYYARMDVSNNNIVTPLFERQTSLAGVFKCLFNISYTDDGLTAFVVHDQNTSWPMSSGITVLDLETLDPMYYVDTKVNIAYGSFDPVPERRMRVASAYCYIDENTLKPWTYFPISKNELLLVNGYSIASINPQTAYLYSYAGIEAGCGISGTSAAILLPEQNQVAGQAKYVNYSNNAASGGEVKFLGRDGKGDIYYMRGAQTISVFSGGLKRYFLPPTIYKISKP